MAPKVKFQLEAHTMVVRVPVSFEAFFAEAEAEVVRFEHTQLGVVLVLALFKVIIIVRLTNVDLHAERALSITNYFRLTSHILPNNRLYSLQHQILSLHRIILTKGQERQAQKYRQKLIASADHQLKPLRQIRIHFLTKLFLDRIFHQP